MLLIERVSRSFGALAPRGSGVLVALSGGGDSVALLFLARELAEEGALRLAGAAHLNHQLRGTAADDDEAFCRALCERVGVPFVSERADVGALARAQKRSVEDAARAARYACLARAADALGADLIATGHTREDQAETFLLRLVRGAGTRGLAAIRPRAGRVVRPLLACGRAELRAYLVERHEPFREDATNASLAIPRNRVRHEVLPYLAAHFSPGIVGVLAREAELARQDEDFLHRQAIDLADRIVLTTHDEIRVDRPALASAHPALSSRVALAILSRFAGARTIGADHVARLLWLAGGAGPGAAVSLPGQHAVRTGDTVVLRPGRGTRQAANVSAAALSIPGEVEVGGWSVAAAELPLSGARLMRWAGRADAVGVSAAALQLPLAVRTRRPGDRFRPLGSPGARKLQDFLVDRKIPRADRDALPLVVDGRDRIVWVAGQAVGEAFRVSDPAQGVILLKVKRLGGSG